MIVLMSMNEHDVQGADALLAVPGGRVERSDERDRVLQLLLSQKRVISLLADRAFPQKSSLAAYGGPRVRSEGDAGGGGGGAGSAATEGDDASTAEADALLENYFEDLNLTEVRVVGVCERVRACESEWVGCVYDV